MSVRWKSLLLALMVIVTGGAARLPFEQGYTKALQEEKLLEKPLDLSMRDQLGQTFFIAVLGGFRSVVASLVELQTITPWQYSNWGVVDELYSVCTTLQPREEHYWEQRAWHLACNARDSYRYDSTLTGANRNRMGQAYVEKGLHVLREGLARNPESWKLWDRLADYSANPWNLQPDFTVAADCYQKAWELSGRRFYYRLGILKLARVPGREREAWDALTALYAGKDRFDRSPSVEIELLYQFIGRKIYERYPEAKLPESLFRLMDSTAVLTPEEIKKRDWLRARLDERAGQGGKHTPRAPQVTSPHLPKLRE